MQQYEPEFSESCLPRTMTLAQQNRRTVVGLIGKGDRGWPFSDRVLVWLAPHWREDIEKFRSSSADSMTRRFDQHQLAKLDLHYEIQLRLRLQLS